MSEKKAFRTGYTAMRFGMERATLLAEHRRLSQLYEFAIAEAYLRGVVEGAREIETRELY